MWPRLIVITVITTLLAGCVVYAYNKGRQSGMQEVQTLWDSEKLATAQAQAEEMMKARQRESALQTLAGKLRLEKRREADRLAREYAAVIDSLRDRPETRAGAGGVPEGADAGAEPVAGCTGAQLSGPDSRFLAGEAARADQLRIALATCIAHADAVERELNASHPASTRP